MQLLWICILISPSHAHKMPKHCKFRTAPTLLLFFSSPAFPCAQEHSFFNIHFSFQAAFVVAFLLSLSAAILVAIKILFFKNSSWFPLLLSASIFESLLLGAIGIYVLPEVIELYQSVGVDLPPQTVIIFALSKYLWISTPLIFPVWLATRNKSRKNLALTATTGLGAVFLVLTTQAIYAPIFKLCSVAV
jgi:hypothetical protein